MVSANTFEASRGTGKLVTTTLYVVDRMRFCMHNCVYAPNHTSVVQHQHEGTGATCNSIDTRLQG